MSYLDILSNLVVDRRFEIVLLAVRDLSEHGIEYSCERYAH